MKTLEINRNPLPVISRNGAETQLETLGASIVKLEKEIKWRTEDVDAMKRKALDLLKIEEGKVQVGVFVFSVSRYKKVLIKYWRNPFTSLRVRKLVHRPGCRMAPMVATLALFLCLPAFSDQKKVIIRAPVQIISHNVLPISRAPIRMIPTYRQGLVIVQPFKPITNGMPYRPLPGARP